MTTILAYPEAPPERRRGARVDGELEVSSQLLYADDLALPGLLCVAVVRSPYPPTRASSPLPPRRPGRSQACTWC
jgi:hypothetical protein